MLTQKDLDEIEEVIDKKLDEKIKFLPTKEEFYTKMDEVMGELETIREEQTLIGSKLSEHSDTLENHEARIAKFEQTTQTS